MRGVILSLAVLGILMATLTACYQPTTYTSTPPPAVIKATDLTKSDWNSVVEAAKKEGTVAVFVSLIGEAQPVITKTLKEKYGINIDWSVGRGAENTTKLNAQRNAGLYVVDAGLTGLATYFGRMKEMKVDAPLEPLLILPEVTDGSKWRTGKIPLVRGESNVITFAAQRMPTMAINTDLVKGSDITSLADVLNPKWKGKIVINDPSVAGAGNNWFDFVVSDVYGKEKGLPYMAALVKQEPVIARDQRLMAEWIARAKYPIGLGASPSEVDKMVRAGAPIKATVTKEGAPLSSGSMNLVAIDKQPHPNALKFFVNWILSREAGEIISKYSAGYVSERTDVSTEGIDPILIPQPKDVLPSEQAQMEQVANQRLAAEVFKELLK